MQCGTSINVICFFVLFFNLKFVYNFFGENILSLSERFALKGLNCVRSSGFPTQFAPFPNLVQWLVLERFALLKIYDTELTIEWHRVFPFTMLICTVQCGFTECCL